MCQNPMRKTQNTQSKSMRGRQFQMDPSDVSV